MVCRSWSDVASAFAFLSQTCTRQSELAAREAGAGRASVEQSMRICFQHVHLFSDCLHDTPHCSAARLVRMLVVCLSSFLGFNMVIVIHLSSEFFHDAPHCSAAHLVRMLVVCLLF